MAAPGFPEDGNANVIVFATVQKFGLPAWIETLIKAVSHLAAFEVARLFTPKRVACSGMAHVSEKMHRFCTEPS